MSSGLLLQGARVADAVADVRITDDRIAAIAPCGELEPRDNEATLDLNGYVLLPAPVEPHAHLDKALTADRFPAAAGTLAEAVVLWHGHRAQLTVQDITTRATAAAQAALARGATAIRTHVDVGEGIGLRAVEALVAVRAALRDSVDIQIVALAYPLAGQAGVANRSRLWDAAQLGVDLIGGAPHISADPAGDLDAALAIAEDFELPVDLHTDERLEASDGLAQLAQRRATGFPHAATASHCVSLGMQPPEVQRRVASQVAAAGVGVVTCPLTNLLLHGRDLPCATPRGLTAIDALLGAGAEVAAGGDNVQDIFNPLGCGDPLQVAQLLVAAGHQDVPGAYAMVSDRARAVMGLGPVRLAVGAPAQLLAVAGASLREAIAMTTEDRVVIRGDRVVSRTRVQRAVELQREPA